MRSPTCGGAWSWLTPSRRGPRGLEPCPRPQDQGSEGVGQGTTEQRGEPGYVSDLPRPTWYRSPWVVHPVHDGILDALKAEAGLELDPRGNVKAPTAGACGYFHGKRSSRSTRGGCSAETPPAGTHLGMMIKLRLRNVTKSAKIDVRETSFGVPFRLSRSGVAVNQEEFG